METKIYGICYLCNENVTLLVPSNQNFVHIHTNHTKTRLSDLLKRFLGDFESSRNIENDSNSICDECLQKIDDYDCINFEAIQHEANLRALLLSTEAKFLENTEQQFVRYNDDENMNEDSSDDRKPQLPSSTEFIDADCNAEHSSSESNAREHDGNLQTPSNAEKAAKTDDEISYRIKVLKAPVSPTEPLHSSDPGQLNVAAKHVDPSVESNLPQVPKF